MGVGVGVDVDSILAKQVSSDSRWQGCGSDGGLWGLLWAKKKVVQVVGGGARTRVCWVARTRMARTGQVRVSATDFSVSTAFRTRSDLLSRVQQ